ncbi:MAG: RseA family anti-sigma factor [Burkholderiales bacterium]
MSLRVSLLLDGQLESTEVKAALDETVKDDRLRDRYTIYRLVGDVLRGNSTPDDGYSARIFEQIRREKSHMEKGYDPLKNVE